MLSSVLLLVLSLASVSHSLQSHHSKAFSLKLYAAEGQLSPNSGFPHTPNIDLASLFHAVVFN